MVDVGGRKRLLVPVAERNQIAFVVNFISARWAGAATDRADDDCLQTE